MSAMSITDFLLKVKEQVDAGNIRFRMKKIPTVCGNPKLYPSWIQSKSPVKGLFPSCLLATMGLIPEDPPYGLTWDDYNELVQAELGDPSAKWRKKLLESVGL